MRDPSARPVRLGLFALAALAVWALAGGLVRLIAYAVGVPGVIGAVLGLVVGFLAARQIWRWCLAS